MPYVLANAGNFAKHMPVCCVVLKHLVVLERNGGDATTLKESIRTFAGKNKPNTCSKNQAPKPKYSKHHEYQIMKKM